MIGAVVCSSLFLVSYVTYHVGFGKGVTRFTGRPGTLDRRRALRIVSVLPKGEVTRDNSDRPARARVYAP